MRHPDHPERYLAGIECDGATYHSSKSARDRDRLREEVLVNKGWDIVRVWSTDWFDNPNLQTARLTEKLEALRIKPAPSSDEYAFHVDTPPGTAADDLVEPDPPGDTRETPAAPVDDAEAGIGTSATPSFPADASAPFSENDCFQALGDFRSHVIAVEMTDWEPHRSILRDAMIETFVRQKFCDPDEWFEKVPGYLRQGTNPVEKGRYLDRICDIVGRLDGSATKAGGLEFKPESGHQTRMPIQTKLPLGFGANPGKAVNGKANGAEYSAANFSELEAKPDASRFYDRDYEPFLQDMVAHVLKHESPIYEDLLVERIARAHGFQRSGERIQRAVGKVIGKQYPRTKDDGRTVVWGDGSPAPSIPRRPRPSLAVGASGDRQEVGALREAL